jgi:ADP-L-glycero-D-manno-heptose 6-epimerase
VHLGACSATTETNADYLLDNNYRYSVDVLEFAIERNIRFIYASSAATYGDGSRGYSEETTSLLPLNMYGFSKHLFDQYVRAKGLLSHVAGLKFFNVFGPNEYHKGHMSSMVYKAVQQIREHGTVELFESTSPNYGPGEQLRDFIYVHDACSAILRLIEQPTVNGLFNIGSGVATTWNTLISAVFAAMNRPPNITYVPMPEQLRGQYQQYTRAETHAIEAALPGYAAGSIESTVAHYVQNYLLSQWNYA